MAEPFHTLTALGHQTPELMEIGPYRINERFDVALASVAVRRGREADVSERAASARIALPGPARWVAADPWSAFWVAPDMWFVEAPFATHEDIASHLKSAFGDAASVSEQTDAWIRLDLSGQALPALLERLSNVDLAQVPDGFATRTMIEHLGCYLIRKSATEVTIYGARSSAASLLHALETTAKSLL